MPEYTPDIDRTGRLIKAMGKVVVIGKPQVRNKQDTGSDGTPVVRPEYIVALIKGVWEAGFPAELTFRIPESILREAMEELVPERARWYAAGREVLLGVGSVCAYSELQSALDMGFDFVVAPSNGIGGATVAGGGYRDPIDFVRLTREAGVFSAPAAFSPSEVAFYLFRDDGLRPDALKIFNSELLAPNEAKALGGLLAPFAREDGPYANSDFVIMPTGAVNRKTGPAFEKAISKNGFFPVLGMSDPLKDMAENATRNPSDYAMEAKAFVEDYGS
ncbi:MAG: hypothetical protein HOH43_13670 [Candidatus Latescibacteria bacterium]|nr:hypothetical protein [Candidatus Latescibacterota bacterium]